MKLQKIVYIIIIIPLCAMSKINRNIHEISMSAGIMTNQAYDTHLSYLYYLNKNIGIGTSFGYYKQWYANHIPQHTFNNQEWNYWKLSEKDYKPQNIYIEPSLSINTSSIINIGEWTFKVGVDLGAILQLPYMHVSVNYIDIETQRTQQKSKHSSSMQWCFFDMRPNLKIEKNSVFIAIGYGLSDFDVYSTYRNIKIQDKKFNDFYPKKKINHTLFLKIGGYF